MKRTWAARVTFSNRSYASRTICVTVDASSLGLASKRAVDRARVHLAGSFGRVTGVHVSVDAVAAPRPAPARMFRSADGTMRCHGCHLHADACTCAERRNL